MKTHTLKLLGGLHGTLRVRADVLSEALHTLVEGARQAARFFVEGESTRTGPRPAWLDSVSRLDVTGLHPGSVAISIESPTLAEAAPERFGAGHQLMLFTEPTRQLDARLSAVDFFGDVLASAAEGEPMTVLADRALLDTCARFIRAVSPSFDGIELVGLAGRTQPLQVRPADALRLEQLRDQTPAPRAVRLLGILDTISATKTEIVLNLANGEVVSARLEQHDPAILKGLFGTKVLVSGMAQYRPAGGLLVVDVEHLSPAEITDIIWESAGPLRSRQGMPVATLLEQTEESGVAALFGTWPGEESDQELLTALRALE